MVGAISEAVDAWLPQTQCTQCGYPHCRAYAEAMAQGGADVNRCPPGGDITINALARLLGTIATPLDPECGKHEPRMLVAIDENLCIGCTLCIQACPVDAIVGAAKSMHTVIASECTGCELCVPPCPVDCIDILPAPKQPAEPHWTWPEYSPVQTRRARERTHARLRRLGRLEQDRVLRKKHRVMRQRSDSECTRQKIKAAVERTRSQRRSKPASSLK